MHCRRVEAAVGEQVRQDPAKLNRIRPRVCDNDIGDSGRRAAAARRPQQQPDLLDYCSKRPISSDDNNNNKWRRSGGQRRQLHVQEHVHSQLSVLACCRQRTAAGARRRRVQGGEAVCERGELRWRSGSEPCRRSSGRKRRRGVRLGVRGQAHYGQRANKIITAAAAAAAAALVVVQVEQATGEHEQHSLQRHPQELLASEEAALHGGHRRQQRHRHHGAHHSQPRRAQVQAVHRLAQRHCRSGARQEAVLLSLVVVDHLLCRHTHHHLGQREQVCRSAQPRSIRLK